MDYKINTISDNVSIEDILFPEINGLVCGKLINGHQVFDATKFCSENNIEAGDSKAFMRSCRRNIEVISQNFGIPTSMMFWQNTDGHDLINTSLVFAYLAFVSPDLYIYFTHIISDTLTNGVAYSDSFLYSVTAERLPTEALEDIIKERKKENGEQQQSDTNNSV